MSQVKVYGGNHSPWVQAVLLGLHDKNIDYSLRSIPTLSSFVKSGVTMPAVQINDGSWQLDSAKILEGLGYEAISRADLTSVTHTWQGVLHRPDNPWNFFRAFSLNHDSHPSLMTRTIRHLLRPFLSIYFFMLIKILVLSGKHKDPDNYADQFLYWEDRLEPNPEGYFGGRSPNIIDFQLFGIIQCHCSIPYAPLIETLQFDPALKKYRDWIARMQLRFAEYPHLFSGGYFQPYSSQPIEASFSEKIAFWFGTLTMVVFFPITILLIMILRLR